jgi:L-fucono-1,5-lactonase
MKLDAHQHFWRYKAEDYPWISTEVLKRTYLPQDLKPHLDAAGFDGTVAVQARSTWEETRWLLELSDQFPWIVGVVGWADLAAPDVFPRLASFAQNPRLCGIRCGIHTEPGAPEFPSDSFLLGIAALVAVDLSFDLLVRPPQLSLACRLAEAAPDQRFILDHIAKPLIKNRIMEPWTADIRRLAALPNVACKVSGMVTEADHDAWRASDFKPYLDVVLGAFGADRLMIGSDWPVCRQAADYGSVMEIVRGYISALSPDEQAAVLGGTAKRWYRVGV